MAPDLAKEAAAATPPAAVVVSHFLGVSLADWAALLTIIYTGLLILRFGWMHVLKPLIARRKA